MCCIALHSIMLIHVYIDIYEFLEYFSLTATPTYSESVFGRTSIKEKGDSEKTRGDMNFAPAYAYYDWSKQS